MTDMGQMWENPGDADEAESLPPSASLRLGPAGALAPELLPHPWTGTWDRAAEEIAFIHLQLERMRTAMAMPDPEAHRATAREELRNVARAWA